MSPANFPEPTEPIEGKTSRMLERASVVAWTISGGFGGLVLAPAGYYAAVTQNVAPLLIGALVLPGVPCLLMLLRHASLISSRLRRAAQEQTTPHVQRKLAA